MRIRTNIPAWLLCASATLAVSCSPLEIELEPKADELTPVTPPGDCSVVHLSGGAISSKLTMDLLPRTPTSPRSTSTVSGGKPAADGRAWVGGSSSSCSGPGEYELSLWLGGSPALSETIDIPRGKQSAVVLYTYGEREPRLTVTEVDLSPPGAGLRRVRFTNYIELVEPIKLYFHDAADQLVGESASIAWGETWADTIPSAATGYRQDPDQPAAQPLEDSPWLSHELEPTDLPCVDALPLGLIVTSSYQETTLPDGTPWRGNGQIREFYTYLPPLCPSE